VTLEGEGQGKNPLVKSPHSSYKKAANLIPRSSI
jgi:hypothetical protein